MTSGVTSGTAPGDTIQGVTPNLKKVWLNLQRTLDNTMSEDGSYGVVTRLQLKKGRVFRGKVVVTFAAQGDTNPDDATDNDDVGCYWCVQLMYCVASWSSYGRVNIEVTCIPVCE